MVKTTVVPAAAHVGTSGWSYTHWQERFYPRGLPAAARLGYYAGRLSSVEINNSFYRLPSAVMLRQWRDAVPSGFLFSAKASRYITHMKKLRETRDSVSEFLGRFEVLGERLGPILFQLPPRWRCNSERLADFLQSLSADYRYVFEFRDHSWLEEPTYELLRRHGAACCIYDFDGFQSPSTLTADFAYLRLHGPAGPYQGDYDRRTLASWAERIAEWRARGIEVYCYFDNDAEAHAAHNALELAGMLAQAEQ
jgi:uncharacterized protein YecE (DUF72 family)